MWVAGVQLAGCEGAEIAVGRANLSLVLYDSGPSCASIVWLALLAVPGHPVLPPVLYIGLLAGLVLLLSRAVPVVSWCRGSVWLCVWCWVQGIAAKVRGQVRAVASTGLLPFSASVVQAFPAGHSCLRASGIPAVHRQSHIGFGLQLLVGRWPCVVQRYAGVRWGRGLQALGVGLAVRREDCLMVLLV